MPVAFDPQLLNPEAQLLDLDRADCEDSLYLFLRSAWHTFESEPWEDGWPIEAVCEHLQAVVDGDIRLLVINIPPRMGKSSVCSVALPAWTWAQRPILNAAGKPIHSPTSGAGTKFVHASYNNSLSMRDSVKCRRLVDSAWYQARWGDRFKLEEDQNTKTRFTTTAGGERLITSVGARITGEGGNLIVIDDPNAANEAFSAATIQETIDWWEQSMPSRLNDPKRGAFVIIQQRLSEDDLSGHILEKNEGEVCHLFLPMRYEADRHCMTMVDEEIFWEDPRKIDGTLLWTERFDDKTVKRLEKTMGPFIAAGQLQQRPEPRGGGIIKREWWKLWEPTLLPKMDFVIATLDTAYTIKEVNDPSALVVWGVYTEGSAQASSVIDPAGHILYSNRTIHESAPHAMLMEAWTDRLELHDLVKRVAYTCQKLEVDLLIIENKAAGISVAQEIRRLYSSQKFGVQLFDPKNQDKLSRLYSVQHLFAEGLIWAPDRPYVDSVIKEVGLFPHGKHDDQVDCVSMGLRTLRDMGLLARQEEKIEAYESLKQYKPRLLPLYPA